MATWDDAAKRAEETKAAGGIFLRLADDKDKFVGAFVGDPHIRDFAWNPKSERYEPWTTEHEKRGDKKTTRYSINVFVVKMGNGKELKPVPAAESVRIWECNNQTFLDVIKVKEKYGLQNWFFEVERNGKKGNSKTSYTVLPDVKLDDEQRAQIAALKLHDLTKASDDEGDASTDMNSHDKGKNGAANGTTAAAAPAPAAAAAPPPAAAAPPAPATTPAAPPAAGPPAAGDDLIDAETSSRLVGRLKALDRAKIEGWLVQFGIKQVKALKRSDLPAAEAALAALETPAAVDPFA